MQTELQITRHEAAIIRMWSQETISGGHWGDGDAVFTDEAMLLDKLDDLDAGEHVTFTVRNLEIMMHWMIAHCGDHSGNLSMSGDEEQLARKISEELTKFPDLYNKKF
ncbi:MAG TPA: hypothetical protein PLN69_01705 [bacterium]|nr:hypothetical protein [bacterium]